jgi:hypothetical protein
VRKKGKEGFINIKYIETEGRYCFFFSTDLLQEQQGHSSIYIPFFPFISLSSPYYYSSWSSLLSSLLLILLTPFMPMLYTLAYTGIVVGVNAR